MVKEIFQFCLYDIYLHVQDYVIDSAWLDLQILHVF